MVNELRNNWFNIDGEFRTTQEMTMKEFDGMLETIETIYGLEFVGSISFSETTDEDYK